MTLGEDAGKLFFVYPDTLPEWWTIVVEGNELDDRYIYGADDVGQLFDAWGVTWLELGRNEEEIEHRTFGWRPLKAGVHWLPE